MDTEYIYKLIENGYECEYLDFKESEYHKENYENLLKDIMALANSDAEGEKFIIIGVKEREGSKNIIGIEKLTDSNSYQQLIHNNIEPHLNVDYFPIAYQGKALGVFRLFDNKNKPYMLKKKYKVLHEGTCYIRKGSHQQFATRTDFDRFYAKKESPYFKIPNSSERMLSCDGDKILSTVKDGPIFRNVGNAIAYNLSVYCYLDILITNQEFFLAGDIPPLGDVSLSKLDNIIMHWVGSISESKNNLYAKFISHSCKLRLEYESQKGEKFFQVLDAGIAWAITTEANRIDFGSGDYQTEPRLMVDKFEYENDVKQLIYSWEILLKNHDHVSLEKIDSAARCLAWKIYNSSYIDSHSVVNELFNYCDIAQIIGRGISAAKRLKENEYDVTNQKVLIDRIVDGANALNKQFFSDNELEQELWDLWKIHDNG